MLSIWGCLTGDDTIYLPHPTHILPLCRVAIAIAPGKLTQAGVELL
ncbi:hypothetical protein [Coleofasciculus sp. F4-SAH-05]